MNKTTYNYSPFTTIPDDLKALIFEYLPLLDYANLAPVCRDFYYILNNTPDLWAKCLFRDFLDSKLCESDLCDDDFLPEGIAIERAQVRYSEILNSKRLLVNHYNLQKQWKAFFKLFLNNNDSYEFVQEIMFGLQCPSYPPPSLKKDVHCFYTNTLFQNFLTEVHFCIQGRSIFQDKKHRLVNNMASQMEQYLSDNKVDKDHLINVRWYNVSPDRSPAKKLTYHRKNKAIQKRNVASRKCIFKGPSYQKSKISKSPSKKSTPNRSSPIKRNRKFLFNLDIETPNYCYSQEGASDNYAERFYWMMQDLTENHCKMIFAYLKILQNPYLLLIEYTRLWNKFVLLIIDFTQTFLPFANAFNKFYEKECSELPNFPEFSTWRLMVKIWYEQVYCNLNYYLAEAFRSILMMTRSQEKFAGLKFEHTAKCSFCASAYETEAGPDCLYNHFFYQFLLKSHNEVTRDEVFRLLRDYYQAISDLSYNEYSIFYWDCNTSMKGTPKESLDSYIFQDSQKFYDYCRSCIFHDTDNFKRFFDSDLQIIENVMGQPFALELQKHQVLIVKSLLENIFMSAVRNADCCYFPDQQQQGQIYNINLSEISKFLNLNQEIYLDLSLNHHKKLLVSSALSKQAKVFSASLFYIAEKQRLMETQIQEFDEIRDHRYLRGFSLTDERYSKFFELGQNPSLKELNQIGMEGKNMKEELESVNDHLVFL